MITLTEWINRMLRDKRNNTECYTCKSCHKEAMTPKEYLEHLPKLKPGKDNSCWYVYYDEIYNKWDYSSYHCMDMSIHGVEYISYDDAVKFCHIFNDKNRRK